MCVVATIRVRRCITSLNNVLLNINFSSILNMRVQLPDQQLNTGGDQPRGNLSTLQVSQALIVIVGVILLETVGQISSVIIATGEGIRRALEP